MGQGRPNLFDALATSEDSFAFANGKRARFQKRWFAAIDQIIARRKVSPTKAGHRDLLDLLLRLTDAETGEVLSDAEIRDQCATMFFAGSETTARLMFWASYLLAMDPEEQASVRKEIAACPPERITASTISKSGGGCATCSWRLCGSIRRWPISFGPQTNPTTFAARRLKPTRRCILAHGSCIAIGDSGIGRLRFFLVALGRNRPVDPDPSLYSLWLGASHLHRPLVCSGGSPDRHGAAAIALQDQSPRPAARLARRPRHHRTVLRTLV